MKLREFERYAREIYQGIPEEYLEGIDGLTISDAALPHPTMPDVYTLGMCVTEPYPSDFEGPDTLRSVVVLYHGSFVALADLDPGFQWREQIWETLTHELRHHLESLAGDDQLEDVDYALDETFKRDRGEPFDPWYFQRGDEVAAGVYRVEEGFYLEQVWKEEDFARADVVVFHWHGGDWLLQPPPELGDVHFVVLDGLGAGSGCVELVLVRKRSAWEVMKGFFTGWRPRVLESRARAQSLGGASFET